MLTEKGETMMTDREKVVNNLNVAKLMLCNPQVLTPEMCVKIGQAVSSAIALLKEQEPIKLAALRSREGEQNALGCLYNNCNNCVDHHSERTKVMHC